MPLMSSATVARAAASSPTSGIDTGPPELAGSTIFAQFSVLKL